MGLAALAAMVAQQLFVGWMPVALVVAVRTAAAVRLALLLPAGVAFAFVEAWQQDPARHFAVSCLVALDWALAVRNLAA